MALPALPPLLTSPNETAPPLAEAVATPPLPAEAVSVYCMTADPPCGPPRSPSTVASDPYEDPKPVGPGLWRVSLGSGVTNYRVPAVVAMQRSPACRASLIALRLSTIARCADLLPSDCPPTLASVSRRAARENLLTRVSVRVSTAKPLRGSHRSVAVLAHERNVAVATAGVRDGH